jgi:hypothetical protein
MTGPSILPAKHWRDKAEEARTMADNMTTADSQQILLRIAEDYDNLARLAEKYQAAG